MYCYIQKIKLKECKYNGKPKRIEPITFRINGKTIYGHMMSDERFDRANKSSYKITIQHSYRENGKVKKEQWHICTMNYYDIVDYGFGIPDYLTSDKLEKILNETGLTEEKFYNLIYNKLDPLEEKLLSEYQETEEYKTSREIQEIIRKHNEAEKKFDDKYGYNTYRECYNVFGELMNEQRLSELKEQYKRNQDYKRSYYEQSRSSYNSKDYSRYFSNNNSSYTEQEEKLLKEAFKMLSMKHHPDRGGDNETMATINNLKEKLMKG